MVLHLPQYRSPPVTQALILVKPPMTLPDLRYFLAAVWPLRPLWDHHRFLLMRMKNVLALTTGIVIVIAVDVVRHPHFLLTLCLLDLLLRFHQPRDILMPSRSATQFHLRLSPSTPDDLLHRRSKRDRNFLLHAPQRRPPADPVVGVAAATVLTETVMIVMIMTVPEVHVMFPIAIETVIDIAIFYITPQSCPSLVPYMSLRRSAPLSSSASSSCTTLSSSTSATILEYLDVLTDPFILFRVFLPLLELRLRTALVPPDSMMDTASSRAPAPDSTLRCLFPIAELHGQALAFRTERDYHLHYALAEITFHPGVVASLMMTCSRAYYAVRALLRDRGLQYAFYVERTPDLPRSHSSRPCLSIFHPFCPQQVRGMALHRGIQHWVFIPSSYQELPLIRLGRFS
ncbi:unnamed protein product [Symbiodinium sp. CCMP2592]|nr:unnamed protein product [Symbiodinium sp. CCMP2592]